MSVGTIHGMYYIRTHVRRYVRMLFDLFLIFSISF